MISKLLAGFGYLAMLMLACTIVLQFSIVIARYALGINYIWAQELVGIMHAATFMLGAAWTLSQNKHVRLDVLYEKIRPKGRYAVETLGTLFLLLPMMFLLFFYSLDYVREAWAIQEGSSEIAGLPGRFVLKTLIPLFAVLMILAGISRIIKMRT